MSELHAQSAAAGSNRCPRCDAALVSSELKCPSCGEPEVLEGKWRIEHKLGEGGMGTVYRARELALDRPVAIKILAAAFAQNQEVVTRFEREARMMAKLDHPNLVPILAVGRRRLRPFIVMKYLDGKTLGAHLHQHGAITIGECLAVARQLSDGLSFMHSHGFIHRDIKPANIFISPTGFVTLLDFGVAHDPTSDLTQSGVMIGTPRYMSPEQVLGLEQIDARSDQYALALVLYESLTGKPVFQGENAFSLLKAHKEHEVPSLTNFGVAAPIAAVFARALAKKPQSRFADVRELYLAFDAAVRAGGGTETPLRSEPATTPQLSTVGAPPTRAAPPTTAEPVPAASTMAPVVEPSKVAAPTVLERTPASRPAHASEPSVLSDTAAVIRQGVSRGRRQRLMLLAAGVVAVVTVGVLLWVVSRPKAPTPLQAAVQPMPPAAPVAKPADAPAPAPLTPAPAQTPPNVEAAPVAPAESPSVAHKPPPAPKPVEKKTPKAKGWLSISVTEQGKSSWAFVEVNGVAPKKRDAPVRLELDSGTYQVTLARPGFRSVNREVEVKGGKAEPLVVELERL